MVARFRTWLFGNIPVEVWSDFPLHMSVQRLKVRTKHWVVGLWEPCAVGRVTAASVRLARGCRLPANPAKPIFIGKFFEQDGRVVLRGRFTTSDGSKLALVVALSIPMLISVLAALGPDGFHLRSWSLGILGISIAALLILKVARWMSRRDIPYLQSVIVAALHASAPRPSRPRLFDFKLF